MNILGLLSKMLCKLYWQTNKKREAIHSVKSTWHSNAVAQETAETQAHRVGLLPDKVKQ